MTINDILYKPYYKDKDGYTLYMRLYNNIII